MCGAVKRKRVAFSNVDKLKVVENIEARAGEEFGTARWYKWREAGEDYVTSKLVRFTSYY